MMDKFWTLLQESTLVQGTLTLLVTGTWLYMQVAGLTPTAALDNVTGLVIGFYFGGKFVRAVDKAHRSI